MSTRTTRRRIRSPPQLPPVWGQDVAPPPTPFFVSPNVSPPYSQVTNNDHVISENVNYNNGTRSRRRRHHPCHNQNHHHRSSRRHLRTVEVIRSTSSCIEDARAARELEHSVVAYSYRFSENDTHLLYKEQIPFEDWMHVPPPNSQSSSPVYTTTGSSPEMHQHPTSPVSPPPMPILRRSTSQGYNHHNHNHHRPQKSVHWLSDRKKRPQDISSDRKIVKYQVHTGRKGTAVRVNDG